MPQGNKNPSLLKRHSYQPKCNVIILEWLQYYIEVRISFLLNRKLNISLFNVPHVWHQPLNIHWLISHRFAPHCAQAVLIFFNLFFYLIRSQVSSSKFFDALNDKREELTIENFSLQTTVFFINKCLVYFWFLTNGKPYKNILFSVKNWCPWITNSALSSYQYDIFWELSFHRW